MNYPEQLRLKQKQVTDALIHIGGFTSFRVDPILPAQATYGYRNKIDLFTDMRYLSEEEAIPTDLKKPVDFALGFMPGQIRKGD